MHAERQQKLQKEWSEGFYVISYLVAAGVPQKMSVDCATYYVTDQIRRWRSAGFASFSAWATKWCGLYYRKSVQWGASTPMTSSGCSFNTTC